MARGLWVSVLGDGANDELVLNENFSDFHHVGHNDLVTLLLFWAVMV